MLLLLRHPYEIDIQQFMAVCQKSNIEQGRKSYPNFSAYDQLQIVESNLSDYLRESMLEGTLKCAVWAPDGKYKAVLRLEEYRDGYLIAGLETAVNERRKGYASALIHSLLTSFPNTVFYSHVMNGNAASVRLHEKCGFIKIKDTAAYLNGTVSTNAATYCIKA